MTDEVIRVSRGWLALREPADAAARASELVELLEPHLPATSRLVIHDLGGGTGAMGRWLAPTAARPAALGGPRSRHRSAGGRHRRAPPARPPTGPP